MSFYEILYECRELESLTLHGVRLHVNVGTPKSVQFCWRKRSRARIVPRIYEKVSKVVFIGMR